MPNAFNRNNRRRRGAITGNTVITDPVNCCAPPETVAEELYTGVLPEIVMRNCCDPFRGCADLDTRTRCTYWPAFAHPRWLTCRELHSRQKEE